MKRIGCFIPHTNYTVEYEIQYLFENGFLTTKDVCFHFAKLLTTSKYSCSEYEYLAELNASFKTALGQLSRLTLDANAFYCTSAGLLDNSRASIKTFTALDSLLQACRFSNIKQCMLVTPYTQEIGLMIEKQLINIGIEILFSEHLNLKSTEEFFSYGIDNLYRYLMSHYKEKYENIIVPCTNLPTFHIIEKIETNLNTTLITSNQSLLWIVLSRFNIPHKAYGIGALLRRKSND